MANNEMPLAIYYAELGSPTKGKGAVELAVDQARADERAKVLGEVIAFAEKTLDFAEHGDYSNGNDAFGVDEGRFMAGEMLVILRKDLEALKSRQEKGEKKMEVDEIYEAYMADVGAEQLAESEAIKQFCLTVRGWKQAGVPVGLSDLKELALKLGTPIPHFDKDLNLVW